MSFHAYPSQIRAKADTALALEQLYDYASSLSFPSDLIESRRSQLVESHQKLISDLKALEIPDSSDPEIMTSPLIVSTYRQVIASQQLSSRVMNEAISNYPSVWNHLLPKAGEVMSSGASSLGWALGAAIGSQMAGEVYEEMKKDVTTVFVGDGSFVFGVPSASYWIARRYNTVSLSLLCFSSLSH